MDIGVISVRYARALLKGSCDAKIENKVYCEMQAFVYISLAVVDHSHHHRESPFPKDYQYDDEHKRHPEQQTKIRCYQ